MDIEGKGRGLWTLKRLLRVLMLRQWRKKGYYRVKKGIKRVKRGKQN